MKKVQYQNQPLKLEAVGNGSHLYRWAIAEITTEEGTVWECYEVVVWNEPTRSKVTEAVIKSLWHINAEAKLLNDYNAANEGVLDISFKQLYIDFITERKAVKTEITTFFESL